MWNRSTDRSKSLLIQNLSAIAVSAQRATEPKEVRPDCKKLGNVFSPQRAGQPRKHSMAAAEGDKVLEFILRSPVAKRLAGLVRGVEHRTGEAGVGESIGQGDQIVLHPGARTR